MFIKDIFKISAYKKENEQLSQRVKDLESLLSPEVLDFKTLKEKTLNLQQQEKDYLNKIENLNKKIKDLDLQIKNKESSIIILDETIELESFSLYKPRFFFTNSDEYKDQIEKIRESEKKLIKQYENKINNSGD